VKRPLVELCRSADGLSNGGFQDNWRTSRIKGEPLCAVYRVSDVVFPELKGNRCRIPLFYSKLYSSSARLVKRNGRILLRCDVMMAIMSVVSTHATRDLTMDKHRV
jgi:hypothetical protein